jgi:hypothetical protein
MMNTNACARQPFACSALREMFRTSTPQGPHNLLQLPGSSVDRCRDFARFSRRLRVALLQLTGEHYSHDVQSSEALGKSVVQSLGEFLAVGSSSPRLVRSGFFLSS